MGAANAIRAYHTYGAILGDHAMRALVYMALVSMDGDAEPWFGLGQDALSEFAYGKPVPGKETDPAGRAAALRSVGRACTELQAAGAIRTAERARFGAQRAQNARYRLYLHAPCPEGEQPSPRRWKQGPQDAERPMGADAQRPMAPDAERPAGDDTIGRFAVGHRTENVCPQDAERPTKEYEEDEERINNGSVVDATVEGAQPELRVVENRGKRRRGGGRGRVPGERPLVPYALEDQPAADTGAVAGPGPSQEQPQYGPPCGSCDAVTRMVDEGDGAYVPCPRCHPYRAAAS